MVLRLQVILRWIVFLILFLALIGLAMGEGGKRYNWSNLSHIEFAGFDDSHRSCDDFPPLEDGCLRIVDKEGDKLPRPDKKWVESEMRKWKTAIRKSVALLPENFLVKNFGEKNKRIKFVFYIDRRAWNTGYVKGDVVYINLLPSVKVTEWMIWEGFPHYGFSEEEMMVLVIHEIGHVYSYDGKESSEFYQWNGYQWVFLGGEPPPSLYVVARSSRAEDFAESFVLYVMYPDYMKNFPKRYGIIKSVLGIEYNKNFPMPESLRSRLYRVPKR